MNLLRAWSPSRYSMRWSRAAFAPRWWPRWSARFARSPTSPV